MENNAVSDDSGRSTANVSHLIQRSSFISPAGIDDDEDDDDEEELKGLLCFVGASLTSLDSALGAFEYDPVGSRVAETAVPHDDCSV